MATIGSWDPKAKAGELATEVKRSDLESFLALDEKQLNDLANALPQHIITEQKHMMTRHKKAWAAVISELEDQQIVALIRFFTLAEGQLPGWEAGSKSPVIWLCRGLKKRGLFPDQELTRWIKANTDNKFLPYGNPLDFQ